MHLRQQPDQLAALPLVFVVLAAQHHRLDRCQRSQRLWQAVGRRHLGVIEQDGDDLLTVFECQRDFPADEVVRIVETAAALRVLRLQPVGAD